MSHIVTISTQIDQVRYIVDIVPNLPMSETTQSSTMDMVNLTSLVTIASLTADYILISDLKKLTIYSDVFLHY